VDIYRDEQLLVGVKLGIFRGERQAFLRPNDSNEHKILYFEAQTINLTL
jgi:hypothetical protein